jgi:hypothetical protein
MEIKVCNISHIAHLDLHIAHLDLHIAHFNLHIAQNGKVNERKYKSSSIKVHGCAAILRKEPNEVCEEVLVLLFSTEFSMLDTAM